MTCRLLDAEEALAKGAETVRCEVHDTLSQSVNLRLKS